MLSKVYSLGLNGIDGYCVEVEVDISKGLSVFDIVGLADTAIKESKERVTSAITNSAYVFPPYKLTVNLAPAGMKKEGAYFDFPIAMGILSATNTVDYEKIKEFAFIGELSLNGDLRGVKGVLPLLISARALGIKKVVIPSANENEGAFIDGIEVYSAKSLREVVDAFREISELKRVATKNFGSIVDNTVYDNDFAYVKGQKIAKRAIEIAVSGGHNILLIGPPGMGKTMLAKCIPSIMPTMTFEEALSVTKVHSVAGKLDDKIGIVTKRPFRSPHHTATVPALCGGGTNSKPGEVSLANSGVLFLDELPEYPRNSIEALRQPLEDRKITIARAAQTIEYPANFMLVASMNPCPCGNYGSKKAICRCTSSQIQKYLHKLSGPLLDRIDIHIEVDSIDYDEIKSDKLEESSVEIKKRVNAARGRQLDRFRDIGIVTNSEMNEQQLRKFCRLSPECDDLLKIAFDSLGMSARGRSRIIKVARTIADIEGEIDIKVEHIAEAISYRTLDKKYWDNK